MPLGDQIEVLKLLLVDVDSDGILAGLFILILQVCYLILKFLNFHIFVLLYILQFLL